MSQPTNNKTPNSDRPLFQSASDELLLSLVLLLISFLPYNKSPKQHYESKSSSSSSSTIPSKRKYKEKGNRFHQQKKTKKFVSSKQFSTLIASDKNLPIQPENNKYHLMPNAKMFQDPYFKFLWENHSSLQSFAETAGGQATYFRSFRASLN